MTLSIKALAFGQLPDATGTLYTTPGATQTIVALITLVNTGAAAQAINIYINGANVSGQDISLDANGKMDIRGPFTLEAADIIEGDAENASEVDYTINGVENA